MAGKPLVAIVDDDKSIRNGDTRSIEGGGFLDRYV